MRTSAELEIVREMKESCCCVALDYEAELKSAGTASSEVHYTLPDGRVVSLSSERFRYIGGLYARVSHDFKCLDWPSHCLVSSHTQGTWNPLQAGADWTRSLWDARERLQVRSAVRHRPPPQFCGKHPSVRYVSNVSSLHCPIRTQES